MTDIIFPQISSVSILLSAVDPGYGNECQFKDFF